MKILKKFLVSCLFSFLFVFSVNAEDITLSFDTYDVLYKFNESFTSWSDNDYVQSKAKEIAVKYASDYENVLVYYIPIQLGQYSGGVLSYNGSTYNPGFVLYAWNGNKPFYYVKRSNRVYLVKDNSTTTTNFSKNDFNLMSIYGYTTTDFSIDNTRSYSSSQLSSPNTIFQCDSISDNKCNIRTYRLYSNAWNYLLPITYYKFNTQDNFILPALKSSDFENINNFILPNGNVIGNINPISFNDLMKDNYYDFSISSFPDATNEKGTYKFDSFAYFIKDFDLGNDKRLKLHFNFMDHIDSDKINIYVNNNGNYISHNLKCLKVSNPKITQCDLDIKYNVNNDRSIALFFDFDRVYDFVFFDSDNYNVNSAFIPTTDNIKRYSVYRDFSLLNKRGVGFYVDDSRILKFINSSYDFKFYKLIEMCGLINCTPFKVSSSNSLSNDLKGLSYSNTYLNFVNDKYVVPNSSNFLKLSFNNSNLVKFTFNKDLVSNNVFPLFLVLNSDIGNNPNEEVYPNYIVQYNSSIFNYFMIKQNLVLSDNGNYYDDNFDSGTTINITDKDGVQKDYTVSPGDSGFQLFSDVDISSYYKNSLDYFKDKIITMFDLVSDLFGSFSVKVKYFFVLMFMLVVGLIIIRLLLQEVYYVFRYS